MSQQLQYGSGHPGKKGQINAPVAARPTQGIKVMKRMIAACILAVTVSVNGGTFDTDDEFTITLPDGWVQIPGAVLQGFSAKMAERSPDAPRQVYDYGYQMGDDGRWLTYPYVLVQVRPEGRIPSGELARYPKMSAQAEAIDLSGGSFGESTYDKEHQILWSTLTTQTLEGEIVKALIAVKLTELGYIRLTGCATEASFDEYKKVFTDAFSTLGMDESIAYRPQFADTMPIIGGIMTGRVIIWLAQAIVIGTVLWLIYIRIKRLARKSKD